MIIEEYNKVKAFGELRAGDVFRYGSINYLKVPPCKCDTEYDYNSYDLDNNDYCYFSNERDVIFVKAKLVIEY